MARRGGETRGFPEGLTLQVIIEKELEGWNPTDNFYWTKWIRENFGDKYSKCEFVSRTFYGGIWTSAAFIRLAHIHFLIVPIQLTTLRGAYHRLECS